MQPHGQALAAAGKGQVHAGQTQQRPAAAKQRVACRAQPGWRLAHGAGGEQHIAIAEQRIGLLPVPGDRLQILRMRLAADAQAVFDERQQGRAELALVLLVFGLQ